jgi:hypothetical protein
VMVAARKVASGIEVVTQSNHLRVGELSATQVCHQQWGESLELHIPKLGVSFLSFFLSYSIT